MVIRIVDGRHHRVASGSARSGRGTIVSQRDIETSWDRGRRGRLGGAVKGGSQITQGERGGRLADHERVGGSALVIRIVDGRHHRVAASSARSGRGTIVSQRDIETGWNRGRRGCLGRAIEGGCQITQGDGGRCLADHESAGGSALVTRLVDGRHHCVAASSARSRRGTIVGERDIEPGWYRSRRDRFCSAIKGGCQITQGECGGRIANHERAGGSALVIRIVDGRHHCVASKSARSSRGTIVGQRGIETGWNRGRRGRLGRAIKGGSQIT